MSAILLVGGYGAVGSAAARALRTLHPEVPLLIAGRRLEPARQLAQELGHADALTIDLNRRDLALDPGLDVSVVAMFVKDSSLSGLAAARARSIPYLAMSEYAFDVAPVLLSWAQGAHLVPLALFGHHIGGLATLTALHHRRDLTEVTNIRIGAIFDADDIGSPAATADAELAALASPRPLIRDRGTWTWSTTETRPYTFQAADGTVHAGTPMSLLDTVSIGTYASNASFYVAVRSEGPTPRHEVVIDIEGFTADQAPVRRHVVISDAAHHVRLSGYGAALALTRLTGLDGRPSAPPGLHLPETLLDGAQTMRALRAFGTHLQVSSTPR